jgi:hypothetical protein
VAIKLTDLIRGHLKAVHSLAITRLSRQACPEERATWSHRRRARCEGDNTHKSAVVFARPEICDVCDSGKIASAQGVAKVEV